MVSKVLYTSLLARIALIIYGEWQDRVFNLKYTDIDYSVFSDAAIHVSQGNSPFDRDTYRYTPLLAYLVLPNVHIHPCFGKVLFSVLDAVAGWLIYKILSLRNVSHKVATLCAGSWVLNPLPLVVSSRGNAESVLACMVLSTLWFVMKRQYIATALMLAISVHFKTYPIIYALPLYLLLNELHGNVVRDNRSKIQYILQLLIPCEISIVFALIGAAVNSGLLALFYSMYGDKYIDETLWYHIIRKDLQHNFSPYFYPLRVAEEAGSPFISTLVGLSAFIPQLGSVVVFSYKYYRDLPFCWFIITMSFVTFNKVCTSQYFLWYLCLLPLILPSLSLTFKQMFIMLSIWLVAQGVWFAPAYYYEYHHYDILFLVWMASLLFFWINVWCMWKIIYNYNYTPLYKNLHELSTQKVLWNQPKTVNDKKKKKI